MNVDSRMAIPVYSFCMNVSIMAEIKREFSSVPLLVIFMCFFLQFSMLYFVPSTTSSLSSWPFCWQCFSHWHIYHSVIIFFLHYQKSINMNPGGYFIGPLGRSIWRCNCYTLIFLNIKVKMTCIHFKEMILK